MVILVTSRAGYESYASLDAAGSPLWVTAGVLSPSELGALRAQDVDVTDFNFAIAEGQFDAIERAVETIKEHHPGQIVWAQV